MKKPGRLKELEERIVYPGDFLAVIEEFLPGDGTYIDNGFLRAARIGKVVVDMVNRRITVQSFAGKPRLPRKGSIVHGYALFMPRSDLAVIRIIMDEKMAPFNGSFNGLLHISQTWDRPLNSIHDAIRISDFVRVAVLNSSSPYVISMKQPHLGVVAAFCSVCGAPLLKIPGQDLLVCSRCGNKEQRKLSTYYLFTQQKKMH